MTEVVDLEKLLQSARSALDGMRLGSADAAREMRRVIPDVQRAADSGNSEFQELLGGVALEYMKDYETAHYYLLAAAKAGNNSAQRGLAYMLFEGLGVQKNKGEAVKLFEAAAKAGDRAAKFNLAGVLLRGDGAAKDKNRAISLLWEASHAGMDAASRQLGEISLSEGDYDTARQLLTSAVEQGSYRALLNLGIMCRDGLGGSVDRVKALTCFLRLLDVRDGDGFHEAHALVLEMTDQEVREAALKAGRVNEGDALIKSRGKSS
ncbi:tetratricopeptide repeat protein [Streptomyces sp. NBC_01022]|uniref:tetratricopeptide repeat protein n=1 Tax=Streptomyces sp. NBC_01022 TaxID=2903723 RepID=UPI002DDA90C8|nr:tetratricopeptide repeat protein [Streptomyces sp. NBC_01022]WRZ84448.1 sel1 repeat family protein [Streptomyces sp. NBC_01022]